eukprot:29839_1
MYSNHDQKRVSNQYTEEYRTKPNAIESRNNDDQFLLGTEVLISDSVSESSSSSSYGDIEDPDQMNAAFVACNMDLIHRSFFSDASCLMYYIDNVSPAPPSIPLPSTSSVPSYKYACAATDQQHQTPCVMVYSVDSTKDEETNALTPHSDTTYSTLSPCYPTTDPRVPSTRSNSSANTVCSLESTAISVEEIISKPRSISQLVHFGMIDRLILDQNGSRYLQRLLKTTRNAAEVSLMIRYCIDKLDLVALSEDVYGNYIVQLFFQRTDEVEQQVLLHTAINDNLLRLSKSIYGCRVIQKCLSCISNRKMLREMVGCFDAQSKHNGLLAKALVCPYTNHVVQAILDLKLDAQYVAFIKRELERTLPFYCEHIIGCRIVQCLIKNYGDKLNVLKLMCDDRHLYLSKTKYGNYVIQCIIKRGEWYSNFDTISVFRDKLIEDVFHEHNILYLSKNKFGSNVVEECIKVANEKQRSYLVNVLASNHYMIPAMINHCYGNYVIRALLSESTKANQIAMIKFIRFYCTNNIIIKNDVIKEMNRIRTKYQI